MENAAVVCTNGKKKVLGVQATAAGVCLQESGAVALTLKRRMKDTLSNFVQRRLLCFQLSAQLSFSFLQALFSLGQHTAQFPSTSDTKRKERSLRSRRMRICVSTVKSEAVMTTAGTLLTVDVCEGVCTVGVVCTSKLHRSLSCRFVCLFPQIYSKSKGSRNVL